MTKEEAIKALTHCTDWAEHCDDTYVDCVPIEALRIAIEALIEQERKRGKWYFQNTSRYPGILPCICTVCGKGADEVYDFCPNCGTRMEMGEEE